MKTISITKDETIIAAKNGSEADKTELLAKNMNLVYKYAHRYDRNYFKDIVQEGCIGLLHAANKYEFDRGTKFSTYASFWISQAIDRGFQKQKRSVRLPSNILEDISKLRRARQNYYVDNQIEATPEDLCDITGISAKKVDYYLMLEQETLSLDAEFNEDMTYMEYVEDNSALEYQVDIEKENLKDDLEAALFILNEREQQILKLHFGLEQKPEKTLAEISRIFNLSRERIRQIKETALLKIKASAYGEILKYHLL
jgi:RNA polymerase primary sigma factor